MTMLAIIVILVVTTGSTNGNLLSRIINGEESVKGDHPHQISLLRKSGTSGSHMCGGSVIHNDWVITAAHCVDDYKNQPTALAVITDLYDYSDPGVSGTDYKWLEIESIYVHGLYNQGPGTFPNDIALLKLAPHLHNLGQNVITLADGSNSFTSTNCIISGWGVTEDGSGASILMQAAVTAWSNTDCSVPNVWGSSINAGHICVKGESHRPGGDGSGACNGDSGGPLVCDGVLAGVTSWGKSGCHVGGVVENPTVYARVGHFYKWIGDTCGCL